MSILTLWGLTWEPNRIRLVYKLAGNPLIQVCAVEPRWYPGIQLVLQSCGRKDVTSLFPPSGIEGYKSNQDIPFQSVVFDVTSILMLWGPYSKRHNC